MREPVPLAVRRARTGAGAPELLTTPLGTLDGGVVAEVDRAGAVRLEGATWSLDWWIGAGDRWYHPSMEAAVRQRAVGRTPVVETALRAAGGDVLHRAGGARVRMGDRSRDAVVVEVENTTDVPVALAVSVRPWLLDRRGTISEVDLEGTCVTIDGQVGLFLSRPPARVAHGPVGAPALELAAGEDSPAAPRYRLRDDLEVVFVSPLPHGATARFVLPRPEVRPRRPRPRRGARAGEAAPSAPSAPSLASVASGWSAHCAEDPSLSSAEETWGDFVAWSGAMLRCAGPSDIARAVDGRGTEPWGPGSGVRVAAVAEALAGLPPDGSGHALGALRSAQRGDGRVRLADGGDGTVGLLFLSAALLSPSASGASEEVLLSMAHALRHLSRRGEEIAGEVGRDAVVAAVARSAAALAAVGQPEASVEAKSLADELRQVLPCEAPAEAGLAHRGLHSTLAEALRLRSQVSGSVPGSMERLSEHLAGRGLNGVADAVDDAGRPAGRLGFDTAELATIRSALLGSAVSEGPEGPVLLPVWSSRWFGLTLGAAGVATAHGHVSIALRWHGGRAALLWEIVPLSGDPGAVAEPRVSAPGIDPSWRATGWSGEALLVPRPAV